MGIIHGGPVAPGVAWAAAMLHLPLLLHCLAHSCHVASKFGVRTHCRIKGQNLSQHPKDAITLVTVWPGVISRSLRLLPQNLRHHIIHIAAHQTQAVQVRTEIRYARPLAKRRQTCSDWLGGLLG